MLLLANAEITHTHTHTRAHYPTLYFIALIHLLGDSSLSPVNVVLLQSTQSLWVPSKMRKLSLSAEGCQLANSAQAKLQRH